MKLIYILLNTCLWFLKIVYVITGKKSLIILELVWDHLKPTAIMTGLISSLHNFSFSPVSFWTLIHLNIHLSQEEAESCTWPIIYSNQSCFTVQLRTLQPCVCAHTHTHCENMRACALCEIMGTAAQYSTCTFVVWIPSVICCHNLWQLFIFVARRTKL